jgi:chaperonin GroEL (HSP60 family)
MAHVIADPIAARLISESMAPMLRVIGLSLGPEGAGVLASDGPTGRHPSTGVAIARAMVEESGAQHVFPKLLTDEMVSFERDFGDGTAQLALLAGSLVQEGLRFSQSGLKPVALGKAYVNAAKSVCEQLRAMASSEFDPVDVACSAGASTDTAHLVVEALRIASDPGAIEVTNSSRESGIRLVRSAGFVMDAKAVVKPVGPLALNDPYILVADEKISEFGTLISIVEGFVKRRKSLVIVAREITDAALATLHCNQSNENFSVMALTPVDAGPRAASVLEDLAIVTGAELIADHIGNCLDLVRPHMLGRARRIQFESDKALLVEPQAEPDALKGRCAALRELIARSRYLSYDLEHAQRRLARLEGKWCQIVVGTEGCLDEQSEVSTVRRALAATRWALLQGVVPGGGLALEQVGRKMLQDHVGDPVAIAAAHALMVVRRHLITGQRSPTCTRVLDPAQLLIELVARAFSFAGSVLQTGAFICCDVEMKYPYETV